MTIDRQLESVATRGAGQSPLKREVREWLKTGAYLPDCIRDFHDQKDLFKALDEVVEVRKDEYTKDLDWVTAQVYTIDIFLWMIAKHGYTLQRNRSRVEFHDLDGFVDAAKDRREKEWALNWQESTKGGTPAPTEGPES